MFTFYKMLINIIIGDGMRRLNEKGLGMDMMIAFMIAFVIFLIIIVVLTYKAGLM